MARRKRRRTDEEKIINQSHEREGQSDHAAETVMRSKDRGLSQTGILQMQQAYGNSYVQRVLEEQAENEEEQEIEPFEFTVEANIREGGWLDLDIAKALDLKNYGVHAESDLLHRIKEWLGVGVINLDDTAYQTPEFKMSSDGRLSIKLGQAFPDHLATLSGDQTDSATSADMANVFGRSRFEVTASLHTSAQDPSLKEAPIDKKTSLLGEAQDKQGYFLMLRLESGSDSPLSDEMAEALEGLLMLKGTVTETD